MAVLHIEKGINQGSKVPLDADKIVLGRNPDCHVVIPVTSVSREHAHIVRVQDHFYIEDMQSRNGTFVNNQQIAARTLLKHNDRIRICDFMATFQDAPPWRAAPPELAPGEADEDDPSAEAEVDSSSTIEAALSHSSNLILQSQPAEKLKALIDISGNLSKTLELDSLWPKIVDSLFTVFRQADRCFIILGDGGGKLIPKVIKTRRALDEGRDRFSRSIVRRCMETTPPQAFLSDDASNDRNLPLSQSVVDFRIRSVMCAALCTAEGKAFGVIQLDTQDRGKKFTEEDLKLLIGVANQASIALENAKLHKSRLDQERAKRDLELAHQVQSSFLPNQLPALASYEFFAHYESALEVGGDYYDFIPLSGGRLAIALGDVAGKGVAAALLMAKLSGDVRYCLLTEPDAATAISKLNDVLAFHWAAMDRFVTLAAAVLDPANHLLTLVNAGHLPPLLCRRGDATLQDATSKDIAGVPLGVLEGQVYASQQVTLEPGDCLLLYTDGVPDATNARGVSFGTRGPHTAVEGGAPYTPRTLGERIIKAVKQHVSGHTRQDDIALVCLGRTGA